MTSPNASAQRLAQMTDNDLSPSLSTSSVNFDPEKGLFELPPVELAAPLPFRQPSPAASVLSLPDYEPTDEQIEEALEHAAFMEKVAPDIIRNLYVNPGPQASNIRGRIASISKVPESEGGNQWNAAEYLHEDFYFEPDTLKQSERIKYKNEHRFHPSLLPVRQEFILYFAEAFMSYGGLPHRLEPTLKDVAMKLDVAADFLSWPGSLNVIFVNENGSIEVQVVRTSSDLAHNKLDEALDICLTVLHDEISPLKGIEKLKDLAKDKSLHSEWVQCFIAGGQTLAVCPLAFGGSLLDMFPAAACAFGIKVLRVKVASKHEEVARVFEIFSALLVAIVSRALSAFGGTLFCDSAISTASIIAILPGFLILSSSLAISAKNFRSGCVRLVFAVIYVFVLAFALRIGSDTILAFAPKERHALDRLAERLSSTVTYQANFIPFNGTEMGQRPLNGSFTFQNPNNDVQSFIRDGCFRTPGSAWYATSFPMWAKWIFLPFFTLLLSMGNSQPLMTREMLVMCFNACATFAVNQVITTYVTKEPYVACAGAGMALFLLSALYARICGGNAFTVTMTGVLLLVPTGLSQTVGITGTGDGISLGGDMLSVMVGTTTGLQMGRAVVSLFGGRRTRFSF